MQNLIWKFQNLYEANKQNTKTNVDHKCQKSVQNLMRRRQFKQHYINM